MEKLKNNREKIDGARQEIKNIIEKYKSDKEGGSSDLEKVNVLELLTGDLKMWLAFKEIDSLESCRSFLKEYDIYRREIGEEGDSGQSRFGFCQYLGNALSSLYLEFQFKKRKNEI